MGTKEPRARTWVHAPATVIAQPKARSPLPSALSGARPSTNAARGMRGYLRSARRAAAGSNVGVYVCLRACRRILPPPSAIPKY